MAVMPATKVESGQTDSGRSDGLMKAIVQDVYGVPGAVLELQDIAKPVAKDGEVLVRVHAASVHVGDWMLVTGVPYIARPAYGLRKPKNRVPGTDVAGTVEAVGQGVTELRPGDEVFGWCTGGFAEYVCATADHFVVKPVSLSFEQAAAVGVSASTALQLLRDQGKVQAGQKVLINGASGGVGTFAVQIAKAFGAEVTGVCSTRNVDLVRSLGADHVIDYTKEDFTKSNERYDVILDNVGTQPLSGFQRVLKSNGILAMSGGGGPNDGHGVCPMARPVKAMLTSPFTSQKMGMMMAKGNKDDLAMLADLMQSGEVKPVIDRTYKLSEVPDAIRYLEQGHARGKVVIAVDQDKKT